MDENDLPRCSIVCIVIYAGGDKFIKLGMITFYSTPVIDTTVFIQTHRYTSYDNAYHERVALYGGEASFVTIAQQAYQA